MGGFTIVLSMRSIIFDNPHTKKNRYKNKLNIFRAIKASTGEHRLDDDIFNNLKPPHSIKNSRETVIGQEYLPHT
jgi:hypothetical protein